MDSPLLSRQYRDYIYIPGFLLVFGTYIVKSNWVPYAVVTALALGAFNFWNFRECLPMRFRANPDRLL